MPGTIEDDICDWQWDGASIEDIKAFPKQFGLTLLDLTEQYFSDGWPHSVPLEYQGLINGQIDRDTSHGENSMAGIKHYLRILACDQAGRAIVMKGVVDLYTDGEGYNLVEMSVEEALSLADEYRAESVTPTPDTPKPSIGMRFG